MFASIAIDAPVDTPFDYAIPPELTGKIAPGHLVQVAFGTGMQHGVVLSLHDDTSIQKPKPILARLDPRPVLTPAQIQLSLWMSETYLAPIGACVWIWLPPGLTGHRDILVELVEDDHEILSDDELEQAIVELLRRRGALRGHQLNLALPGKPWRAAVDTLAKAGIVEKESTLTPPRVRPKVIQTAALAIHPDEIPAAVRGLERPSIRARLLEHIASSNGRETRAALKAAGATKSHLEKLVKAGLVSEDNGVVKLAVPRKQVPAALNELRKVDKLARTLNLLAREGDPIDVSWIYAQTDINLSDLKRLEEEGLVILGEKQTWRDSLAERDFLPVTPPILTPEQEAAWEKVRAALIASGSARASAKNTPIRTALPPRIQGGGNMGAGDVVRNAAVVGENYRQWRVKPELYAKLKPLVQELRTDLTPAEQKLWSYLKNKQIDGFRFRRQHPIERFIVDFYCAEANLVIEVDGEVHQYTQEEDALRQETLESLGLKVIRFTNDEVFNQLDSVINRIRLSLYQEVPIKSDSSPNPPPPEFGEGSGVGSIFLLHGVTGSGKTEIYLRAIELTLEMGRDAIFLVPEIALTAQTVQRVAARFPGVTAVVHSGLSEGERYDTWRRAREGLVQVVVGARSALFTPLRNVGLIILDEEHDASYKQSPPILPPYYHTRQVAERMMRRNNGVVILGSATPDVETVYRAEIGELVKLELPNRIMGHRIRIHEQADREGVITRYKPAPKKPGLRSSAPPPEPLEALTIELPPVTVVDMREELKRGNTSIFSKTLQEQLKEVLARKEQAILFLNRRGQSTYVFCRDCGYVASCPRCDTPLTYHRAGAALRCHRCGFEQPEPQVCPQCNSRRIKFFGAGTQQVEQALIEQFPEARIVRWDADTAATPGAHDAILHRFMERHADIMVGTQMVAKGLDLPLVTLVGVVSADVGLALPDFRANERTFQLLTQVAGRAGRGLLGGRVVLQTYQPGHYAVAAASRHDYAEFYAREIAYRREMGYPPFRRLIRLLFRFPQETKARAEAERAAGMLRHRLNMLNMTGTELIGPAPCFFQRENAAYRWHLFLRGPDPLAALRGIEIPRGWYVDVDPAEVL
jgi:primosomal protein N'